jgi:phosphopantetheinyl transferase
MKEAFYKLLGKEMSLKDIKIRKDDIREFCEYEGKKYFFMSNICPDYCITVCSATREIYLQFVTDMPWKTNEFDDEFEVELD